jgi:PadR family transcriptional regulator AphA
MEGIDNEIKSIYHKDIYLEDILKEMSMRENKSKYAVLGMLALGPKSGYDIKKGFEKGMDNFWRESYGQIYPILKSLVKAGLAVKQVAQQVGKPDKHIYVITSAGQEELVNWLRRPVDPEMLRIEILLKLFFGRQITVSENIGHVRCYREKYRQLDERLEDIEQHLKAEHVNHSDLDYFLITLSYGRHMAKAITAWCDETTTRLAGQGEWR